MDVQMYASTSLLDLTVSQIELSCMSETIFNSNKIYVFKQMAT